MSITAGVTIVPVDTIIVFLLFISVVGVLMLVVVAEVPGGCLLMGLVVVCVVTWVGCCHREGLLIEQGDDTLLTQEQLDHTLTVLLAAYLRQPVLRGGPRSGAHGLSSSDTHDLRGS